MGIFNRTPEVKAARVELDEQYYSNKKALKANDEKATAENERLQDALRDAERRARR